MPTPHANVPVPRRLADLPRDRRGFVVPAEAGWDENGPLIEGLGQSQTFGLSFVRACAVCGLPARTGRDDLELQAWFRTEADCLDYLEGLRWPAGFVCCDCGHAGGWRLGDGRFEFAGCQARTSTTAGTIFNRTRTPLTVWFTACWMFASDKGGVSALSLQRALEIGSYQTAWTMLHRLRSVLVRPGRERLAGTVEVGETIIGGREPGLRGGRASARRCRALSPWRFGGRRVWAGAVWRHWRMRPPRRCTPSSPAMWSRARR